MTTTYPAIWAPVVTHPAVQSTNGHQLRFDPMTGHLTDDSPWLCIVTHPGYLMRLTSRNRCYWGGRDPHHECYHGGILDIDDLRTPEAVLAVLADIQYDDRDAQDGRASWGKPLAATVEVWATGRRG